MRHWRRLHLHRFPLTFTPSGSRPPPLFTSLIDCTGGHSPLDFFRHPGTGKDSLSSPPPRCARPLCSAPQRCPVPHPGNTLWVRVCGRIASAIQGSGPGPFSLVRGAAGRRRALGTCRRAPCTTGPKASAEALESGEPVPKGPHQPLYVSLPPWRGRDQGSSGGPWRG